jgi:O-antigen ligase
VGDRAERGTIGRLRSCMNRFALWSVSILVFTIPWENIVIFGGDTTIARYVGYAVMIACILSIAFKGSARKLTNTHFLIFGFVSYAIASNIWTVDGGSSVQSATSELQLAVMVILVWQVARSVEDVHQLMNAYVAGGVVAVIFTVQSFLSGDSTLYERYAAGGFDPNDLALTLVISIPIACFLAHHTRRGLWCLLYYVYIGAVLFAIGLTASRGGALAALVSLVIIPISWAKEPGARKIFAASFGLLLLACLFYYMPDSTSKRLATIDEEMATGTLNGRTVAWDAGLRSFGEHPFLGVGIGAFRSAVSFDIPGGMVAHNTFITVLVECGILGGGIFLIIIGCLIRTAWCMRDDIRLTWLVLFSSITIGIFGLSWLDRKPLWLAVALALAHAST